MVLFYRSLAACIASGVDQFCLCLIALLQVFTQAGVVPAISGFILGYNYSFYLDVSHTVGEHGICC